MRNERDTVEDSRERLERERKREEYDVRIMIILQHCSNLEIQSIMKCKCLHIFHMMEIQDPSDLSPLYFAENNSSKDGNVSVNYVSPSISIGIEDVAHGRGLIATKDIEEGELLFVTSPTISVDHNTAKQILTEQNVPVSKLEEAIIDLLVENMYKCLQEDVTPILNSFLVLMGSSKSDVEKEIYSIQTLLGQNDDCLFSRNEVEGISRSHLKNIILKNGEY